MFKHFCDDDYIVRFRRGHHYWFPSCSIQRGELLVYGGHWTCDDLVFCGWHFSSSYVQKHLSTTYSIVPAQPRTSQASAEGTGSSMSCSTREGWKGTLAPTYSGPTRLPAKSLMAST